MDGIVAKRCLRGTNIDFYGRQNQINKVYNKSIKEKKNIELPGNKLINKVVFKTKMKLWVQLISVLLILSVLIIVKILELPIINNNKMVKTVKTEYHKNYKEKQIFLNVEKSIQKVFVFISPIVPDKIENKIKKAFLELTKKEEVKTIQNISLNSSEDKTIESKAMPSISTLANNIKTEVVANVEQMRKYYYCYRT